MINKKAIIQILRFTGEQQLNIELQLRRSKANDMNLTRCHQEKKGNQSDNLFHKAIDGLLLPLHKIGSIK